MEIVFIIYIWNKIGDIGAKYLGLALSKLIKLTNLFFKIYLILFIIKLEILELNI